MLEDLIKFKESEKYGAVKDKIYDPPPLPLEDDNKYEYYEGRYIVKDKELWPKIKKLTKVEPEK